jgi:excisionase family DNA binding protein
MAGLIVEKLLLTPEEAADVLSLGRTKVYELIGTGALRSIRIGKCRRVPVAALEELIRSVGDRTGPLAPDVVASYL